MREGNEPAAIVTSAFDKACGALGLRAEGRDAIAQDLVTRMSEPHRRYHAAQHIASCVGLAEDNASHARHPHEVVLALLFHDAIYDPRASDNEARSAALAVRSLHALGAAEDVCRRVRHSILATAGHEAGADRDAELVLACDLAILGASVDEFAHFEAQIRQEYAFVPDDVYRAGRARVLASFVVRPRIYAVPAIARTHEAPARRNLSDAIARLSP